MATSKISTDFKGSVKVTGNGTATLRDLLNSLYGLVNWSKVTASSYITFIDKNYVLRYQRKVGDNYQFVINHFTSNSVLVTSLFSLGATLSVGMDTAMKTSGITFTDQTTAVISNGVDITLYY